VLKILSLCDHSGVWSAPWREAGFIVDQIDLQDGGDVRFLEWKPEAVYGILAAPPCTMFCIGSAHLWQKRTPEQMAEGLAVVDACLRAVAVYSPVFWALENPVGQLDRWLGPPTYRFHPYDFGDGWTKRTNLWGRFRPPAKSPVEVTRRLKIENAPTSKGRMNARSQTPPGFARAFYEANRPDRGAGCQ
jgi:hypothetical protein